MKRSSILRCLPLLLLVLASCSSDPNVQAQRYVDNGNKFFAKAKYKEAAIMYRKAIARSPLSGEAYYRMGLTDMKLGGLGDAIGMPLSAFLDLERSIQDRYVDFLSPQYLESRGYDPNQARRIHAYLRTGDIAALTTPY